MTLRGTVEPFERPDIGGVVVNSAVEASVIVADLRTVLGLEFPSAPGKVFNAHPYRVLWITPRCWMILCELGTEYDLAARINRAFPDKCVHATIASDGTCWLELKGRAATDAIRRVSFISLEPGGLAVGHAKRTDMGGVAVIAFYESALNWLIGVDRSRASYLAEVLRNSVVSRIDD
jgi:heterotetrameric sarcosine oxidase gamma subunit